MFVCFVDYEKAFDRVNWSKMMEILQQVGVDWRDRNLIRNLYLNQSAMVRIDGENSGPGNIGRSVRQGCPLSPLLFNIYAETLIRDAFMEEDDGITVGGNLIQSIRFADDQAVTADSNEGLKRLMDALSKSCKDYDMRINKKKTKVMRVCRGTDKSVNITVDGIHIEQEHELQYLGSVLSEDAYCSKKIKRRFAMGKAAFNQRKELMCKGLNMDLRKRIMKVLVWSVVLYGSETWTKRKEDEKRLEAFEMCMDMA